MTQSTAQQPPVTISGPVEPPAWPRAWLLTTVLSVCAMAAWQRTPDWPLLVVAMLATIGATLLLRTVRAPRAWAIGTTAALFATLAIGVQETYVLGQIRRDSARWIENDRNERADAIASRIRQLQQLLTESAGAAADAAAQATYPSLPPLALPATGRTESGMVLYRNGQLLSHVGQSRVPLSTGPPGLSLVKTPFYTAIVAHAQSDDAQYQAVAVALLASAPPADRFTQSLVQEIAGERAKQVAILEGYVNTGPAQSGEEIVLRGTQIFARVAVSPRDVGEAIATEEERARARSSVPLVLSAILMLVSGWRRPARTRERLAMVLALLVVVALIPLGQLSNRSGVFSASNFFTPMGSRFTANVAALILTASLVLSGLFLVLRSPKLLYSRRVALVFVLALAGAGPFILRDLARGIVVDPSGPSTRLWMAWQLAIALSGASVLVAGASAGQVAIGSRRGLPWWLAPLIASGASIVAIPFWSAGGGWPAWYPVPWIVAIVLLALVRRGPALIVGAAIVAGSGAVTLTWGQTVRARMNLAATDVSKLALDNSDAEKLLQIFASSLQNYNGNLRDADVLVREYASSYLSGAGFSARIGVWLSPESVRPDVDVRLASVVDTVQFQRSIAALARATGRTEIRPFPSGAVTIFVAGIPLLTGDVITVAVPPINVSSATDPFEVLTGLAIRTRAEPPYRLSLDDVITPRERRIHENNPSIASEALGIRWWRGGDVVHGDGTSGSLGAYPVHIEIDVRGLAQLVPRGALLVLFDVAAVLSLWGLTAMADGGLWRWLRQRARQYLRSYRVRLSIALIAFFAVPAAAFAGWAALRLRDDDHSARELIVREALRVAALSPSQAALSEVSFDVGASLYLYRNGQLIAASDSLLDHLSPIGRLLPRSLFTEPRADDLEDFTATTVPTGSATALVGFRRVRIVGDTVLQPDAPLRTAAVVATPARGNDYELDERRADLAVQSLFSLALGAFAALWLSGVAARSLARPVGTLREAALSLAAGQRSVKLSGSPAEFVPVFSAFEQMAGDLSSSRDALEAAQRRTEAVLQHVASGVLALQADGTVLIANPRVEQMLGMRLRAGVPLLRMASASASHKALAEQLEALLNSSHADDASFDLQLQTRQLTARITRLPAGVVLTLDDVTDVASAQRVLAWGEMARQVAHEIKNPLTPIRLGVQHLRRAYRDGRGDFSDILEKNVSRVLEEIDHLDEIARAFSRYGTAPAEREAPQVVSLGETIRAVLTLESLGESGVVWNFESALDAVDGGGSDQALARAPELKEVLLNLLENARLAQATRVDVRLERRDDSFCISVVDDGSGIAPDVLPRIFEPHFSTRTSGSGLGLAISRRLIESWGGTVSVSSQEGSGTTVSISLRAATSTSR
jgi:two-component system nitrogen regulation sensor histidine kinase NtrY